MNNLSISERKQTPIFSGVLQYFPDAIIAISQCSFIGNEQHNPGTSLHWDRSKSGDELDALCRHMMQAGTCDTDGVLHSTKVAWRALANLQKELEKNTNVEPTTDAVSDYNSDRLYVVTYGKGDNIENAKYDYCFFTSMVEASEFYDEILKNGAITADISKTLLSTD